MKPGATRKTITSDLPPPSPPPPPLPPHDSVQNTVNDKSNDPVQQEQPLNDVEVAGSEFDNDYEEIDQSDDDDIDEGAADGGQNDGDEERPKLAEGFFEVEAIRKKRIRKGKPQYFIKWRGWPEHTNTWEPVENLLTCPALIEAYEESLRHGKKRSNRKGKRKQSVVPTPQSKKKKSVVSRPQQKEKQLVVPTPKLKKKQSVVPTPQLKEKDSVVPTPPSKEKESVVSTPNSKEKLKKQAEESSPLPSYDIPTVRLTIVEEPSSIPSVPDANLRNGTENIIRGMGSSGTTNLLNDTGLLVVSTQIGETEERNELDGHHNKHQVAPTSNNLDSSSDFAIHVQEAQPIEGVNRVEVGPSDGILKVIGTEPTRVGSVVGAKRRKSCAVKRFKKEPNSALRKDTYGNTTGDGVVVGEDVIQKMNGLDSNNIIDAPPSIFEITKIIKIVNYSASMINDTEEVSAKFLVRRSDGEEVVVDNKYLKENNPILLINFYEKHLLGTTRPSE